MDSTGGARKEAQNGTFPPGRMLKVVVPSYSPAMVGWQEDRMLRGMTSGSSEVARDHASLCLQ